MAMLRSDCSEMPRDSSDTPQSCLAAPSTLRWRRRLRAEALENNFAASRASTYFLHSSKVSHLPLASQTAGTSPFEQWPSSRLFGQAFTDAVLPQAMEVLGGGQFPPFLTAWNAGGSDVGQLVAKKLISMQRRFVSALLGQDATQSLCGIGTYGLSVSVSALVSVSKAIRVSDWVD